MPISITDFVSYLLLLSGVARAQISAPNCTDSSMNWNWTLNSLQQSPCLVGAYLQAVCNDSTFNVPTLSLGHTYSGPTDGNLCNCNTVVYSLMSACGQCQDGGGLSYPLWSYNCSSSAAPGVFPKPVPDGTRVPLWAYMPSWVGDDWDSTAAQIAGDSPEVTGSVVMTSASQFPYSPTSLASSSLSTFSPTASRSASSPTSSHTASGSASSSTSTSHSSNRGEMEGSVVGGIVGATLIFGIVVWFVRRRRARSAPSTTDTSDEMEQPVAYQPLTIKTPKLYNPSDPTTYPTTEFQPQRFGSTSHLQPSQVEYSGLPEL